MLLRSAHVPFFLFRTLNVVKTTDLVWSGFFP